MWVKYPSSLFLPSISFGKIFDAGFRVASVPGVEDAYANHLLMGAAQRGGYEAISPVNNAFSRRSVFLIVPYPAYVGGFRDTQYLQVI